jgi:hypothetical protein
MEVVPVLMDGAQRKSDEARVCRDGRCLGGGRDEEQARQEPGEVERQQHGKEVDRERREQQVVSEDEAGKDRKAQP